MTPELWEHISRLFEAALALPAAERDAFVQSLVNEPEEVRSELAALLTAHGDASATLISDDFGSQAAQAAAGAVASALPEAVGPYAIEKEIGRGGMGVVYLARRADGQFEQQVALKLVKRGMDTDEVHRRFLFERQLLARLQHPGIARLLDGGISDDGRPWFALEYIDGSPLYDYCDEQRLGLRERLALFLEVCDAVRYAHRALVVHRDLKPSNILVTKDGAPRLLDFGIAKLMDDSLAPAGAPRTEASIKLMTPEYGAPEQLSGGDITTATDVYALGVILYELLSGHRPYDFDRRSAVDMHELIVRTEPPRPSTRVRTATGGPADDAAAARSTSADRLSRALSGDLDVIALKALAKAPERRYDSARALAEDIRRYLDDRPIEARPDSVAYRAAKFLKRHALGAIAAAIVAVSLVGGLATAVWQGRIAAREAARADATSTFLLEMLASVDPDKAEGREVTVRSVLDEAAGRLDNADTPVSGKPAVEAAIRATIGNTYKALGDREAATDHLAAAVALYRPSLGDEHPQTVRAISDLGASYFDRGMVDEAEPLYEEALATSRRVFGEVHELTQLGLVRIAGIYFVRGDFPRAEIVLRDTVKVRTAMLGPEHEQTLISKANLGTIIGRQKRSEEAAQILKETLEAQQRLLGYDHRATLYTQSNLANIYNELEQYDESIALERSVLERRQRVLDADHPEIADAQGRLAIAYLAGDYFEESRVLFDEAMPRLIEHYGSDNPHALVMQGNEAILFGKLGRYDEAEAQMRHVVDALVRVLGNEHGTTVAMKAELDTLLQDAQK
ncbi:MAG: serine/threonine-protein kinase [Pseudomonadota bacterium]